MRAKRYLLACLALFVAALAWNGLLHLVLLRRVDAVLAPLLRQDFRDKAWLTLVATAGMVAVFAWGYGRFARDGSRAEGARYGLYFALVAGLLVDLDQYALYPIPAWVAAAWFAGGVVEFQLYAALLARLLPPAAR
jgi:hypothetical protein